MDKDSILKLMSFLSNDLDRSILKSLLRGPKDIRTLCRDINRKRSTVFDNLKEMEENGVIQSNKVKTPGRGRNKKEYTLKEFYIPEITKGTLLDFLEGKDVKAKSLDFGDMALIGGFSQMFPVPPEKIFDLLLSSGVDFKYILQIILDLVSEYQDGIEGLEVGSNSEEHDKSVTALYNRIAEIMQNRYPIRNEAIEKFIEVSKDEIVLTSQSGTKKISTKDLVSIAIRELGILEYEAEFIAPAIIHMLKSHEFSEMSYAIIVDLLYLMAKNMKIDCKESKFYIESLVVREFKEYKKIEVRDGSVIRKWGALQIADFLSRRLELSQNPSKFLANMILHRLKYIDLESYDISFIESLARELIREHRI